jgi:hypothetical protein
MSNYPEARLAAAVLIRAIRDARDGNGHAAGARAWLRSSYAQDLVTAFDVDPDLLVAYVEGLDPASQPGLPGIFEEA